LIGHYVSRGSFTHAGEKPLDLATDSDNEQQLASTAAQGDYNPLATANVKEKVDRGSRKASGRKFQPKGYQKLGVRILSDQKRPKGYTLLCAFTAKPDHNHWKWIKEDDAVKYYPAETRRYVLEIAKSWRKRENLLKSNGALGHLLQRVIDEAIRIGNDV